MIIDDTDIKEINFKVIVAKEGTQSRDVKKTEIGKRISCQKR